jgi:hypothetical protein
MRTFLAGNGADVTSTVMSYLQSPSQQELFLANLVMVGDLYDFGTVLLTDWESPLSYPLYGTFFPASISRGKLSSQIGLQVDALSFDWSPRLTAFGTTIATANPYQRAISGFYDNKTFRMFRTVMPTKGDANTYGACVVFGGRIAETTVERLKITFSVNSFLDVNNNPVPPNVIEANNTLANFAGNTPVVADGESIVAQFTVATPPTLPNTSGAQIILANCTAPTPGKIYGFNKFRYGYIVFNPGSSLAGYFTAVAASGPYKAPGGLHYNQLSVLAPFPWPPQPGDSFYVSTRPPINLQDAATGFEYFGFPFVPQPETAA